MHGAVKVEVSDTVHNRKFSPAWLKYLLMLVVMQGRHEGLKNIQFECQEKNKYRDEDQQTHYACKNQV